MIHRWSHERYAEGPESTASELLDWDRERIILILEDGWHDGVKIPGRTRIPPGLYELDVRTDSPKFAHYYEAEWSRDWFRGVPWFRDIEGDEEGFEALEFTFVYYHPGTTHRDSRGCPLTALELELGEDGDYRVGGATSRAAFRKLCELVYPVVLDGDDNDRILVRVHDVRLASGRAGGE